MVVLEGSNVTLRCEAKGYPKPHIMWRREGKDQIHLQQWQSGIKLINTSCALFIFFVQVLRYMDRC